MLRNITRSAAPTLRRHLHSSGTGSTASTSLVARRRLGLLLGASAAAATYISWRLTSEQYQIAMEGPTDQPAEGLSSSPVGKKLKPKAPRADNVNTELSSRPSSSSQSPASTIIEEKVEEAKSESSSSDTASDEVLELEDGSEEGEAASGGAFNPVTGEINWDCPCLGGMAHGPCGLQFREAFSCFVFSEEEPKGINCVDKFKAMQDCFREHPEVYADEIMDDDEDEAPAAAVSPEDAPKDEGEVRERIPTTDPALSR